MRTILLFSLFILSFNLFGQKKVLLEKITSANCGSCPNASIEIGEMLENHPDVIWINHHWWTDEMGNSSSTPIITGMNASGTPQGMVDRVVFGSNAILAVGNFENRILERLNEPAYCDIDLTASIDTVHGLLEATVKVRFNELPPEGDLRLSLIVTEDDMTGSGYGWNQSNYYNETAGHPLFDLGQPIRGYEHQNVVRKTFDNPWGTPGLLPSVPELNFDYIQHYSWDMDELIQNPVNVELVAAVNFSSDLTNERSVLNATFLDLPNMDIFLDAEDLDPIKGLSISPNPTNDLITLTLPEGTFDLQLYNLQGQILKTWSKQLNGASLSLGDLSNGIYMLRMESNGQFNTLKVVVK